METAVYLIGVLVVGVIIGYFIFKTGSQKKYVLREELTATKEQLSAAQIDNAKRISKEELEQDFVPKVLFQKVSDTLEENKKALEQHYVPKNSFEIINKKLNDSETAASSKDQLIQTLNTQLTTLEQREAHLNDKLNIFKTELESLHAFSKEQFRNLATDIMKEKKEEFVLENKKEISLVIDPFKNDLKDFKEKVEATRKEDIQDITSLKKELESLQKLNTQLSDDAKNLTSALKSEVKLQGNWGEDRLNMILETEGLQRYIDYSREEMYRDDEQELNRRPDFILNLPNGKHLIIDSKVSLTAYVNYFNAADPEEKKEFLKQHVKSVSDHIEKLADKTYQSLAGLTTPDYVFMFMPIEPALTLAINQNPELINNALKRKIVLITPTTLIATLKVIKIIWQKENQVKNVESIFKQCGALYDKFVGFAEDMIRIKNKLKETSDTYDDAMNKLKDGRKRGDTIIGRLENIKKLEATTTKAMPETFLREIEPLDDDTIDEVVLLPSKEIEE